MRPSLRFQVLERDEWCCLYCGAHAPNVELHVDHLVSKRDGGTDDLTNLVTACKNCNLGKASLSVDYFDLKYPHFRREAAWSMLMHAFDVIAVTETILEAFIEAHHCGCELEQSIAEILAERRP